LLIDLAFRLVKEKTLGLVGGAIVLLLVFTAAFADLAWLGMPGVGLSPYDPNELSLGERLAAPSDAHWLGTDNLGRDLLSRIIHGARISITVGLVGSLICTLVATIIALVSGFIGGWTDIVIQRFVDAWMCFPGLFVFLTVMALVGAGLWQVIFVLGIARGIAQSRVLRGAVIGIKENVYVEAARAVGATTSRTLLRHILPNIMAPVLTIFAVSAGYVILGEATLSFLGYGIPPPTPSWGGMLSGAGRRYMEQAPWLALWPGLALAIVVYGMNMLGDAIRDLLDPRLRGGLGRYAGVQAKARKETQKAAAS
jgi:peptide/nickel transport system permease protein